ncbi:MAG: transposase [Planctomycetes bacterium]|nr:transposase [Planctomycetota bacterium]MBM4086008.1 transposase [Planctomycetota bacterium]
MSNILLFEQPELAPRLPTVEGNVDYLTLRQQLERMDELLAQTGAEGDFVAASLQHWQGRAQQPLPKVTVRQRQKFQEHSRRALRCNLARTLFGESFRDFSARLADSPLLQWFCGLGRLDVIRVPAKSTLQRYATWLPEEQVRSLVGRVLQAGRAQAAKLDLAAPLDLDHYFLDTTCLKANIHFPVDWVLLGDATRTLMRAVKLIRDHGLKHRMEPPAEFVRRMNHLSMAMTHARRQAGGRQTRKKLLRAMKRQVKVVAAHARRHRQLLAEHQAETDLTPKQAAQVLGRIDGVLALLPAARQQAHERIIGERPVANADKLLSLYETDTHVIVRGKAGAEVEFGNTLLLGENAQGLIADWKLFRESAPADARLLQESVRRVEAALGVKPGGVVADRGFDSAANAAWLEAEDIHNGVCPRSARQLARRRRSRKFCRLARRRSQTEGRIGILKNQFLGRPLRAKGFAHRELALSWAVLTHDLWVLARLPRRSEEAALAEAA